MDAITLLKNDHKAVESLFKKFEKLREDQAEPQRELGGQIIELLSVHAVVEEQFFYPAVREALPQSKRSILKSLEAHHAAKSLLAEVDRLTPESDRYIAKFLVLIDSVRHHVAEEEGQLFPQVREALGRKELAEIGDALEQAKKVAPTKPHPHAPDVPPGNLAVGAVAAIADRARTVGERVVGRARRSRSS